MDEKEPTIEELRKEGKRQIGWGAGLGVLSVGAVATFGALACPFCVVAAPAFVAAGAAKLKKAKDAEKDQKFDINWPEQV